MRSAEWSGEAAIENQENDFFVPVVAQLDSLAIKILQGKIRSGGVYFYFCHLTSLDGNLFCTLFAAGWKFTRCDPRKLRYPFQEIAASEALENRAGFRQAGFIALLI
jgi:hypothetical protein